MYIRTIATGRLVRDAEFSVTKGGTQKMTFTVACDRGYGEKKKTTFLPCICFGRRAESLTTHLTKGSIVTVDGELEIEDYEHEGQKRKSVTLFMDKLAFVQLSKSGEGQKQEKIDVSSIEDIPEDLVPF